MRLFYVKSRGKTYFKGPKTALNEALSCTSDTLHEPMIAEFMDATPGLGNQDPLYYEFMPYFQ
jgi:hypothetical protein